MRLTSKPHISTLQVATFAFRAHSAGASQRVAHRAPRRAPQAREPFGSLCGQRRMLLAACARLPVAWACERTLYAGVRDVERSISDSTIRRSIFRCLKYGRKEDTSFRSSYINTQKKGMALANERQAVCCIEELAGWRSPLKWWTEHPSGALCSCRAFPRARPLLLRLVGGDRSL